MVQQRTQVTIEQDARAGMIAVARQWAVPSRFYAHIDDPTQPYLVHLFVGVVGARAPELLGLSLEVRDLSKPGSITGAGLRSIKVAESMKLALERARQPLKERPDVAAGVFEAGGGLWGGGRPPAQRRGRRLDDAFLRTVADVYRESEHAPVERVMERLHGARSSAGRWVMLARKRGFLGPAIGTRAGEAPTEQGGAP